MKKIITAISDEKLNDILRTKEEIIIENCDIQYQEGIIEALDKSPDTDILIVKDNIIGSLEIEELIRRVIMINQNIEIILIGEKTLEIEEVNKFEQVIKIVYDVKDYENEIIKYLEIKNYIKSKNETKYENVDIRKTEIEENKFKQVVKKKRYIEKVNKGNSKKEIIIVLGNAGVRKNYIYSYVIKINQI